MWLLNTRTLELEDFVDERVVRYAILSHTWGQEEVTFQEMRAKHPKAKQGYVKIEQTCKLAWHHSYEHGWVDTCCINKESSAELSEAINSMFSYYAAAAECFVYLADVLMPAGLSFDFYHHANDRAISATIEHARWFTRGWTLQELIAPRKVLFFDASWAPLGSREHLCAELAVITGIDIGLLEKGVASAELDSYSIAARMAWAANRQTTRREDRAYSLLGLFNINMPVLYGEGDKAFQRLQEEILKCTDDQSILAWKCGLPTSSVCALLAPSPDSFSGMSEIVRWRSGAVSPSHLTNLAFEIEIPIIEGSALLRKREPPFTHHDPDPKQRPPLLRKHEHYAILNCYFKNDLTGPVALAISLSEQFHSDRHTLLDVAPWSYIAKSRHRSRQSWKYGAELPSGIWSMRFRNHDADGTDTQASATGSWSFVLVLCMRRNELLTGLTMPHDDIHNDSFSQKFVLELNPSLSIQAECKRDQTVMDEVVDVISLSVIEKTTVCSQ